MFETTNQWRISIDMNLNWPSWSQAVVLVAGERELEFDPQEWMGLSENSQNP